MDGHGVYIPRKIGKYLDFEVILAMWLVDKRGVGWPICGRRSKPGATNRVLSAPPKIHLQGLVAQCFPTKIILQNCLPKPER